MEGYWSCFFSILTAFFFPFSGAEIQIANTNFVGFVWATGPDTATIHAIVIVRRTLKKPKMPKNELVPFCSVIFSTVTAT